ncbi:MAG TPA: carboxypeptidase-like regulatory domain-containing protein, partial [Thermoanaerobaculia bacterium]
ALALDPAAAVSGQVVDGKGAPAAGVLVQAIQRSGVRQRQYSRTGTAERSTSTGPDGRFRLDKLLAGESWEVRALRPGFAAARVDLPVLRSRSDLRLVLEKGRNGFGKVVDRAEKPVRDAEVVLLSSTGEASLLSERRPLGEEGIDSWQAATDAAGRFEAPALPPGGLDLLVRKSGFAPVLVRAVQVPRGEGPFDLGTIILEPSVEIRGKVTGRDGKPVAGAEVHATRELRRVKAAAENGALERKPEAVTDAEGRFAVNDLRRGDRLDLWVRARGFLPAEVEGVAAPNAKQVAVVLDPATRVSGRVLDAAGLPVAGAGLNLSTETVAEEKGLLRQARREDTAATSDEEGRFTFEDVRPGRAELQATAAGFQPAEPQDLEVPAGKGLENLKVVMERGAVVEGRVLTTAGEPVGDARVLCGPSSGVSDADGVYRLEGVPPGPQTVQAHHQDFPPAERKIEVEPVSNQLDMVFESGHEVSGRVVDREGKAVEGARVSLYKEENPRDRDTLTGADGSFVLAHLADGDWSVRAEKDGYATAELPRAAKVAGAPVRDLEVRLTQGGKIAGRLLGLEMYDLAEVNVHARREDGYEKAGKVDYSGRYEVGDLPAGDWLVRGSLRDGAREAQARAALETGGEEKDVDLEFGADLTLSGRVLLGGEPLKGARVSLAGQDVAVRRLVESDWEGFFRLEDVEPGRYRLQVSSSREMASHSEDLTLDSDRELLVDLGSARFSGTVVDESSSAGIPGAVVALRRLEGEEAAFLMTMGTDEEGWFVLPSVTEGRYRVTVTKDGYAPWEQVMQVTEGAPLQEQRIPLSPTRGMEIAPSLASGRRPAQVTAALRDGGGRILLFEARAVDGAGVARFPTAPSGEWDLLVSAPGAALTEARVKVPGEAMPVVLPDAGRLTVRVPQLATS